MFTTFIVQPIFNVLVLIYALLPGHNFGLSIILFTILARILMWPLVKKQLHQAKAMRDLQPELKRIKKAASGDKQKESAMMMELYKERGINPFGTIGLLIVQLPLFIGLYNGLHRIVTNPHALVDFAYPAVRSLPWIKTISQDISRFDQSLFGVVDLMRSALYNGNHVYWPAMIIVLASAIMQYFQAKQLAPDDGQKRGLKTILRDAGKGQQADQTEINAAVGRSTRFMLPIFIFMVTVRIASALSLYWLISGLVAYWQQARVLAQDKTEMTTAVDTVTKNTIEAEILPPKKTKPNKNKKRNKKQRR